MQRRVAAALSLLAALTWLAATACACSSRAGGRDDAAAWDRHITLQGRRRSLLSFSGRRCGAVLPPADVLQRVEFSAAAHAAKEAARVASGGSQAPRVFNIPTFVYNVVSNDGTERGFVSDAGLKLQIAEMNKAYATAVTPDGVEGTSAARAKITWNFSLQNITRIKAGDMCDSAVEKTVKAASRKGGRGALNLYITDLSACGLLGYSTWPWELEPKAGKPNALIMDGVVIHFETLPKGTYKPFNMGRTCIHETGHWMGLYHVFQNGCSKGGDQVDDTPYQSAPTEGCPKSRDSCPQPGTDPFWNFMDYTDDKCMKGFTPLQHQRMATFWAQHRGRR
ncbi:hypothetical protein MNEG_6544 [Monoraphidium neglectum]|uniref:Peptidase M43 pregnancy-associated plasma-A domain-containing protein n=1 Tax=Monoraphidium neglectum TaxID=145388 RepID=A0A0D2MDZ3_9CHLO|nr:hypothetical protein MNEG_6544 [Monoraphidium neglectum]KIZ01415.1 hypothetical protein MNEG_6544 [Monoraphidium neglectum]|eukprot:XP_013900434.1 hypothetical protein MNEG_6544 [Monoraphidium neglectum]